MPVTIQFQSLFKRTKKKIIIIRVSQEKRMREGECVLFHMLYSSVFYGFCNIILASNKKFQFNLRYIHNATHLHTIWYESWLLHKRVMLYCFLAWLFLSYSVWAVPVPCAHVSMGVCVCVYPHFYEDVNISHKLWFTTTSYSRLMFERK